jgi:UDP-glucose 4-epimerase
MKKNIVISGGFGHVGSELAKRMALRNNVLIIDNSLLGRNPIISNNSNINIINDDVKNLFNYDIDCDYFYHLGEYSRVEQSLNEPSLVFNNNIGSIVPVLDFCHQKKAKLVYAGSSTKFADDGAASNTNPYAISKKINTDIVNSYCEFCKIEYAIVYLNNVYGPGELGEGKYATVIEKFLRLKKENSPLIVSKPGTQRRAFTHVLDTVNAIELVGKSGLGDGFIICDDKDYSVLEVANYISDEIKFVESNKANRSKGVIDNTKLKGLGWSPSVNLLDYLDKKLSN